MRIAHAIGIPNRQSPVTGVLFTPADLSGLVLWLKADAGITIATGVSAWLDQSTSAVSFTQGTGANQPTFNATGINGHPGVQFFAAGPKFLTNASVAVLNGATGCTMLAVCQDGTTTASHIATLTAQASLRCNWNSGGDVNIFAGADISEATSAAGAAPLTTATVISGTIDRTLATNECTMYVSGVLDTARPVNGDNAGAFGTATMFLGIQDGVSLAWNGGLLGDLVIYNRVLTTTERLRVERSMAARYGIATA